MDSQGYGVAGVNYYTNSGRGATGENGEFSLAGETIPLVLIPSNWVQCAAISPTIALTELVMKFAVANIDQLIHRYLDLLATVL
ncbi:hypothetical protein ACLB1M_23960 [Escherichia coli]